MSTKNLMTSNDEIKANKSNITKVVYRQITPDRGIARTDFPNGEIIYRFTVSGNNWWVPSKSFLSMRSKLYSLNSAVTAEQQCTLANDQAPAPGFMACLFAQAEVRLDDRPLSRISSFLPQIDALKTRLTKSKAWRDSIGKSTNFWETDFNKRHESIVSNVISDSDTRIEEKTALATAGTSVSIATTGVVTGTVTAALHTEAPVGTTLVINGVEYKVTVATNGTTITVEPAPAIAIDATTDIFIATTRYGKKRLFEQKRNNIETTWQPPLGIFDITTPLPPGNYSLHLTPNTSNYKNAAFESIKTALTTQDVVIEHMYFNACTVEGHNIPDDFTYFLDLSEINLQPKALSSAAGEQVLDFSVAPTTYALSVATQQKSAGTSTLYPPTKFKMQNDQDEGLTQLRLTYAAQVQPSPDLQVTYSGATDHLAKLYVNTLMAANGYDSDVLESKQEWLEMGLISHYTFLKPAGDASTRVDLAINMGATTSGNALLFSHYSQVAEITYQNGRTTNVRLEYA
jgi:hypothetical protein